ncbi:hypothetical protein CAPTEDRAFT_131607, partial [Capitella teleta]
VSRPITFLEYVVIADYKATEKKDVSLNKGRTVSVVEKHDNGWWFVQFEEKQGWAPASFLEPKTKYDKGKDDPEALPQSEKFEAISTYKKTLEDEVGFAVGAVVEVMHKMMDGWWVIS